MRRVSSARTAAGRLAVGTIADKALPSGRMGPPTHLSISLRTAESDSRSRSPSFVKRKELNRVFVPSTRPSVPSGWVQVCLNGWVTYAPGLRRCSKVHPTRDKLRRPRTCGCAFPSALSSASFIASASTAFAASIARQSRFRATVIPSMDQINGIANHSPPMPGTALSLKRRIARVSPSDCSRRTDGISSGRKIPHAWVTSSSARRRRPG
ncbi:MAG: hypothetical protein JWR10_489 [Rubritepida sp.]|nr:hypothetical protein [Rubritepida sp.]